MDAHAHWNRVYTTKEENDVSWFEAFPAESLRMIEAAGLTPESCVIDVGGGDSRLVDQLAARGLTCLAVLDVSDAALQRSRARLGTTAADVTWIAADVTGDWAIKPMDVWHDRAVFHFLVDERDRAAYRQHLCNTLKVGGSAIIATFALDGPTSCSGLPVSRYSAQTLAAEFGDEFALVESLRHVHHTPWGSAQSFQYSRFTRIQ
jgi:hypothetical protein